MKQFLLGLAFMLTTSIGAMTPQSEVGIYTIAYIEVQHPYGALFHVSINGKPLPELGAKIPVTYTHPQNGESFTFQGTVTAYCCIPNNNNS